MQGRYAVTFVGFLLSNIKPLQVTVVVICHLNPWRSGITRACTDFFIWDWASLIWATSKVQKFKHWLCSRIIAALLLLFLSFLCSFLLLSSVHHFIIYRIIIWRVSSDVSAVKRKRNINLHKRKLDQMNRRCFKHSLFRSLHLYKESRQKTLWTVEQ